MSKPKLYDEDDITRYIDIGVGQIKEEFKLTFEAIDFIKEQVKKIPGMEADIGELKDDVKAIKAAVKATNKDLKNTQKDVKYLLSVAHSH